MRELKPEGVIYKIDSAVGQGLSSTVYKAVREDSQGFSRQIVALKILRSETAVSWLRHEFQALARVRSPHCVKVHAWENLPEGCALVLEWIDGISLLDLARSTVLSGSQISEILSQVQEGLRAVHREGLHHGDLSPGNILIDADGLVRIVDFGIDPQDTLNIHGTPAYMAPELWQGGKSGIASDLFALGLIELDLKSGFSRLPGTPTDARTRAIRVAENSHPWLDIDPSARKFIPMPSNEIHKSTLAALVRQRLEERDSQCKTIRLPIRPAHESEVSRGVGLRVKASLSRIAHLVGVLIFCLTLSGLADAPAFRGAEESRGEIEIRSLHWLRIQINGVDAGYAPLALKGLKPGRHRLVWESARGRGEVRLMLPSGGRILLKEKDLARLQSTGKD